MGGRLKFERGPSTPHFRPERAELPIGPARSCPFYETGLPSQRRLCRMTRSFRRGSTYRARPIAPVPYPARGGIGPHPRFSRRPRAQARTSKRGHCFIVTRTVGREGLL